MKKVTSLVVGMMVVSGLAFASSTKKTVKPVAAAAAVQASASAAPATAAPTPTPVPAPAKK